MTFTEAKATQAQLDAEVTRLGAALNASQKGAMGLTPDSVKFGPEFRTAKSQFDAAFHRLRTFNAVFTKAFRRELLESRRQRGR